MTSKTISNGESYKIDKAHVDWSSVQVQMVTGMLAIFCFCLINFVFISHLCGVSIDNLGDGLFNTIEFGLYFGSGLLTALIALEITGRFGNRLGAGCALWSGLLFCILPVQVHWCMPSQFMSRVLSFTMLLVAFVFARRGKNWNWFFLALGIIFCLEAIAYCHNYHISDKFGGNWFRQIHMLFFSTNNIIEPKRSILANSIKSDSFLFYVYSFSVLLFLVRLAMRMLSARAFLSIAICMLAAGVFSNLFVLYSGPEKYNLLLRDNSWALASAFAAITYSLVCLPAIDMGRKGPSRLIACLGLLVLLTVSIVFEKLFTTSALDESNYYAPCR